MVTLSPHWASAVPRVKVILPGWSSGPKEALALPVPSLAGVPTLPVGIVEVPFLIHALAPALGRAGQAEVPGWKL